MQRFVVTLGPVFNSEETPGTAETAASEWNEYSWLYPEFISVGLSEFGELRLKGTTHPDTLSTWNTYHQGVRVTDTGTTGDGNNIVFDGVIVKQHVRLGEVQEDYEAWGYDNGTFLLHRCCLHGQRRRNYALEADYFAAGPGDVVPCAADELIVIDTPLIFNPDGSPNQSEQTYSTYPDVPLYIFEQPFRKQKNTDGIEIRAVPWTLSHAVSYVLHFANSYWGIDAESYSEDTLRSIFDTYGDPVIADVNLEGKSVLEALRLLLNPHNFDFWINPGIADENSLHQIHFIYRGGGEQKQVLCVPRGDIPTDFPTPNWNVINLDLVQDVTPVVNEVTAFGDRVSHTLLATTLTTTGTLKLVKGWKDDDLVFVSDGSGGINTFDVTFRKNYCHPEMITVFSGDRTVYGIGRLWLVNQGEAADRTLEDLTTKLGGNNSLDQRSLRKPEIYTKNAAGGILFQEDIQVEMSFDSGTSWDIVENCYYRVLPEGMGIVFTEPMMEMVGVHFTGNTSGKDYWQALNGGTLAIRILCSVQSDDRLTIDKPNTGDVVPLATQRFYDNLGYKKSVYSSAINASTYYTKFKPLTLDQDDTTALTAMTELQKVNTNRAITTGTIAILLRDWAEYAPGDVITEITNRFTIVPSPTVYRTVYKLQDMHVELALDSRMVKTIIGQKKQVGEDLQSHKMGIAGTHIMEGATYVPYRPGDMKGMRTHYIEGGK